MLLEKDLHRLLFFSNLQIDLKKQKKLLREINLNIKLLKKIDIENINNTDKFKHICINLKDIKSNTKTPNKNSIGYYYILNKQNV